MNLKTLAAAATLFAASATTSVQAQSLSPVYYGAEWEVAAGYVDQFSLACQSPTNGVSCYRFPNGGLLHAIAWQSSTKTASEVLAVLVMSSDVSGANGTVLLSNHHIGKAATMLEKALTLPKPIVIPPGYYIWVRAEGYVIGRSGGRPFEVQTTLYVEGAAPTPVGWVNR